MTGLSDELAHLKKHGRLRQLDAVSEKQGCNVVIREQKLLNLSSNDYLGIAGDKELHHRFYACLNSDSLLVNYGMGAASSRLLTGDTTNSHLLEDLIKTSYAKEACLLYNSGYHANIGILPALTGKADLILSDKLNHASIVDGMRLSAAKFIRYRHCDYEHLRALLEKQRKSYRRVIIVSESVFSMDGDVADLGALVEIKNHFACQLYIDEAHSVGLYGEKGLGMAEQQNQLEDIDFLVGTFGKAFASVGAFLLCSERVNQYLINKSRSLIFTTALPPIITSWNIFIFSQLAQFSQQRKKLKRISDLLRKTLRDRQLQTAGTTNIIPVIIGDDQRTVKLSEAMREQGYLMLPVRPPTVPVGTSRFRISLTAGMDWCDLEYLADKIATLVNANDPC
ncbi:MAG: 8-amino-7-oxononanoate synthase [Desulfotalea sp.]|nr:MAG: 8-amino-7-oxononanoate synthase [Desulfotalea sp.]